MDEGRAPLKKSRTAQHVTPRSLFHLAVSGTAAMGAHVSNNLCAAVIPDGKDDSIASNGFLAIDRHHVLAVILLNNRHHFGATQNRDSILALR